MQPVTGPQGNHLGPHSNWGKAKKIYGMGRLSLHQPSLSLSLNSRQLEWRNLSVEAPKNLLRATELFKNMSSSEEFPSQRGSKPLRTCFWCLSRKVSAFTPA